MPSVRAHTPTVSVIMPVYNGEQFVAAAISSILSQTYRDFEFIIVQDASTDDSAKIIAKFAQKDKRIRVITNQTNQGQSPSANIGFRAARGQYIARMDQDDIALPKRLALQVAFLNAHPAHLLVGSQVKFIDENGKITGTKQFPTDHAAILKTFGYFLPFCHPSIMVRRSLLHTTDRLWFEEGDPIPDTYTFFYYVTRAQFANLPETLLHYRVHSDNGSYQNIRAIFKQTIRFRLHAIREWGYPFRLELPLIWLLQAIPVFLLPNQLIQELFFVVRGIKPWRSLSTALLPQLFPVPQVQPEQASV